MIAEVAEFVRGGLRDLSIIATPPPNRLAVQTFVVPWDDAQLRELLPYGFGVHHAGLARSDRELVEEIRSCLVCSRGDAMQELIKQAEAVPKVVGQAGCVERQSG